MNLAFVPQVLRRIRTDSPRVFLPYSLGRFAAIRRLYGGSLGMAQSVGAVPGLTPYSRSFFPGLDRARAAAALKRDSVYVGLTLPRDAVERLLELADRNECVHWRTFRRFHASDVDARGRFSDGTPAILADVADAELDPTVHALATDPAILEVLELHLGYRPLQAQVRLLRSFLSDATDEERRFVQQTIDYHFDVHSYSFGYLSFYLTDVDADSGPHIMIRGSHDKKPLRWLFDSAIKPDDAIERYYGKDHVLMIAGHAGTGFLQDASCYHKALPPRARARTMIQIRYY
ncbi:MAG TPA: hypothetical protein VGI39_36745 [Polyangiaceae bacterium]|jgi:hypothetical protein